MYFQTFFLLFSESESARAKNSSQIKRGFFLGGGVVTVLWPLPFYVEGCDIVS